MGYFSKDMETARENQMKTLGLKQNKTEPNVEAEMQNVFD